MKKEDKKLTIVLSVIVLIILASLLVIVNRTNVVGKVAYANVGCCDLICQETSLAECPNQFHPGKSCEEVSQCNVGCCVEEEGYCYDNYLQSNCQDKGEFKAISCINHPRCTTEFEEDSFIATTGFPVLYEQEEFLYSEPLVGKYDLPFTIKSLIFENTNVTNININISSENNSEQIVLFNDGAHGDGNANDMLYAGIWHPKYFQNVTSVTKVKYETQNQQKNYLLLTPTACYPVLNYIDENYVIDKQQNVIFVNSFSEKNSSLFDFNLKKAYNFLQIKNTNLIELENKSTEEIIQLSLQNKNFNYYSSPTVFDVKDNPIMEPRMEYLYDNCPFLYQEQDEINLTNQTENKINYVIYLSDEIENCQQYGNMIEINSEFIFTENASKQNVTLENILNNFCEYTQTINKLVDEAMAKQIPPLITITNFDDMDQDTPLINLSFVIQDNSNKTINYTIYSDLNHPIMHLYQNQTLPNKEINLNLTVPDGKHIIQIEAQDKDGNLAISKSLKVEKRVNDFVIQITSLNNIAHVTSPNITFNIIHKDNEQNIKYEIYDIPENTNMDTSNGTETEFTLASGSIKPSTTKTLSTDLTIGPHTIYITAEDNNKNNATSWPYYIEVGNNEEPEMYSAGVEWYE